RPARALSSSASLGPSTLCASSPIRRSSRKRSLSSCRARAYPSVNVSSISVTRGFPGSAERVLSSAVMRSRRGARSAMSTTDYGSWPRPVHGPEGLSSRLRRPISWTRALLALTAVFVALVAAAPAGATLKTRLDRALRAQGVSTSQPGGIVFGLSQNAYVYRKNSAISLKPASNEKLPVAVTSLSILGPGHPAPSG